jgi:hypothetical protein
MLEAEVRGCEMGDRKRELAIERILAQAADDDGDSGLAHESSLEKWMVEGRVRKIMRSAFDLF